MHNNNDLSSVIKNLITLGYQMSKGWYGIACQSALNAWWADMKLAVKRSQACGSR
jgi:hypothetical protein